MKPNKLRNKINKRNWELLLDARDEACRTSYLDYYRKSIQELSAN